jgi:hypothetical protein
MEINNSFANINEELVNRNKTEINYNNRTEEAILLTEELELNSKSFGGCEGLFITDGKKIIGAHYPNLDSNPNGSGKMNLFLKDKLLKLDQDESAKVIFVHTLNSTSSIDSYKQNIEEYFHCTNVKCIKIKIDEYI